MNLVLDLGNTSKKLALFRDGELVKFRSFKSLTAKGVLRFCSGYIVTQAILSSVVSTPSSFLRFLKKEYPLICLDENTPVPLKILYKTPATLGKDRLACAVAARTLFPGVPVLCIDAGTCIKYDFVTAAGEYLGGAISPGLGMRLKAMHRFTSKLPLIGLKDSAALIGSSTGESLLSGALNGAVAEVSGIIENYRLGHKGLKVLLTGGNMDFFEDNLKSRIFAQPFLLMQGLNFILDHNAVNKK